MRIPPAVSLSLVVALVATSAVLWRQLHTERQLNADLQTQLTDARTALATRPQPQPVVAANPQPAPAPPSAACPPTVPEKPAAAATAAAVLADSAKRQKTLLENSEFRKARIAGIRSNVQLRLANLPRDLGLSPQEADALFNIIAEGQLRQESLAADQLAGGAAPDAAAAAELERATQDIRNQQKAAMVALLGPERANDVQDYRETVPSRQRASNLTNLLTQAGKPLSDEQSKSLTSVIIAEQRREESEAALATSDQPSQQSQADRATEGDRRILAAAAGFLDAQQIELMRARFDQVRTRNRSAAQQQRAAEAVLPDGGN